MIVPLIVHRADAVGIAVERDAQVGCLLDHFGHQRLQIRRHSGVGMMIRKTAVHLKEHFSRIHVQPPQESGPITGPPVPLPASTTTRMRRGK